MRPTESCARAVAFVFLLSLALTAQDAANPAIAAADRLNESWWAERHNAVLAAIRNHPDIQLVLLGDSITNNYDKANPPDEDFQPTWNTFYAPRKALNLGFSGDRTEHVLWRLRHGEVEGLHPKVVIVLIGTNNTGHGQTAEQTETGIDAVIAELEERLPDTHILLLGILPSDRSPAKTVADRAINRYLANGYGENPRVTYLDIGSIFYAKGALNANLFYDPRLPSPGGSLHPDTNGQRRMAEAMEPTLARWMGDAPRVALDAMTDINTAVIPVERLEQDVYDWYARHHAVLELQKSLLQKHLEPPLVMIGDSITHFWGGMPNAAIVNGPKAWQSRPGVFHAMNMGFGWDRTQNVLWRLRQGEFNGLHPNWVVIAIGTNNLTGTEHARANTPEEIVEGIAAIREEVGSRSPTSKIIVMGIFPRGAKPDDPLRAPIRETNRLLAERFRKDAPVTYLDIGEKFLQPDGTLPASMMPDGTHPSEAAYQIWADALGKAGIPGKEVRVGRK